MIKILNLIKIIVLLYSPFGLVGSDSLLVLQKFEVANNSWQDPILCLKLTKEVIPLIKDIDKVKYCYALNTLSYIYNAIEEYDSLLVNNEYVLIEIEQVLGTQHLECQKAKQNLALAYKLTGSFEKAKILYQNVIEDQVNKEDLNLIGTTCMNLGNLYKSVKDYDMAFQYYDLAELKLREHFFKNLYPTFPSYQRLGLLYKAQGQAYFDVKNIRKAKEYYHKSYDEVISNHDVSQYVKNSVRLGLAEIYIAEMDYEGSKRLIYEVESSIGELKPSITSKLLHLNAQLVLKGEKLGQLNALFDGSIKNLPESMVRKKIELYLEWLNADFEGCRTNLDRVNSLIQSLDSEEKSILSLNYSSILFRHTQMSEKKRLDFIIEKYGLYDLILGKLPSRISKIQFLESESSNIKAEIKKILSLEEVDCSNRDELVFYLIELSKGLLNSLNRSLFNADTGASLMNLQREIYFLNLQLEGTKNKAKLAKVLLQKKIELEGVYKSSFSMKKTRDFISLNDVKSRLINQTYISYYCLDNDVLSVSIDESNHKLNLIYDIKDAIEFEISKLLNPQSSLSDSISDLTNELLEIENDEFLVSPASYLNDWPFENSRDQEGVLKAVRRIYSLDQLTNKVENIEVERIEILKPYYRKRNNVDSPSLYTFDIEVLEVDDWFNNTGSSSIFHFSGHSTSKDSVFGVPSIYLQDTVLGVHSLYYSLLRSPLVVLSSCESNGGAEIEGEGINNLTRSLNSMGAKAVISTLWQVNDRSTSVILERFYFYLIDGKIKSRALALAKNDFLSSCPDYQKHPYYWSGIVLTGDNSPLLFERPINWSMILLSLGLILTLLLVFRVYSK